MRGLKTGGRKKGVQNKITSERKERIEWALDLIEKNLENDIKKLTPAQRMQMWEALQEYIRPKLARTEMSLDGNLNINNVSKQTKFEIVTKQ